MPHLPLARGKQPRHQPLQLQRLHLVCTYRLLEGVLPAQVQNCQQGVEETNEGAAALRDLQSSNI